MALSGSLSSFDDSIFWKDQILKLKNVVKLDIYNVRLTDESIQAIGEVCKNVRKLSITSDLKYASMESLKHILKCQELRELRIRFSEWDKDCIPKYVRMLVVGLPNLEYFHDLLFHWDTNEAMSLTEPLTSMVKLSGKIKPEGLKEMIHLCPNLTDLELCLNDLKYDYATTPSTVEHDKLLKVLSESSPQLTALTLYRLSFNKQLGRVISSSCAHLTRLYINLSGGKRISVNDVYTIGESCPKLVELHFVESMPNAEQTMLNFGPDRPKMKKQKFVTTPPMFVELKVLEIQAFTAWDQRIVPLILRHADNLASISLDNVFNPLYTSVDPLSQILDANALQQLESLTVEAWCYDPEFLILPYPKDSIERLLDQCHKLVKLNLQGEFGEETADYLAELPSYMNCENYDFTLVHSVLFH